MLKHCAASTQTIPLSRLLRAERQKLLRGKSLWFAACSFLAILFLFFWASDRMNQAADFQKQELARCKTTLGAIEQKMNSVGSGGGSEESMADYQRQYGLCLNLQAAYEDDNWKKALEIQNRLDTDALEGRRQAIAPGSTAPQSDELQSRVALRNYLLKNEIKPMDDRTAMTGWNSVRLAGSSLFPLLLPLLFLALSAGQLSEEEALGTWKLSLRQPVPRGRIVTAKLAVCALASSSVLTAGLLFLFLLACAANGAGNPAYPVPAGGPYPGAFRIGNAFYTTSVLFAGQSFLLLLCAAWFYTAFGLLVSVLTKSPSASITAAVLFPVAFLVLGRMNLTFLNDTPFGLTNSFSVLTGSKVPPLAAGGILLLSAAICQKVTAFLFKRKDFLC